MQKEKDEVLTPLDEVRCTWFGCTHKGPGEHTLIRIEHSMSGRIVVKTSHHWMNMNGGFVGTFSRGGRYFDTDRASYRKARNAARRMRDRVRHQPAYIADLYGQWGTEDRKRMYA